MTADSGGTIPMFGEPAPAEVRKPGAASSNSKPRWSKYKTKNPVKCDRCLRVLAMARGEGPATMPARFKRVAGGKDELLCYLHAQAQRTEDGLAPYKDAK